MLPGMDGVELAKRLRREELTTQTPLVMLTARGEETDKLKSFAGGIDDYITKPFSPRELLARVKALLRRSGKPQNNLVEASGICLDLNSYRMSVHGKEIQISPTEYKLLEVLMRNPDRAFERSQLLDRVWGRQIYVEERTVDVHMLRLRKILKPHGVDTTLQTVRGIGYRFTSIR
jgi:two-component system phosphate regulon response regulator PhoB